MTNSIVISQDGDKWCALLGENLQEGLAGFGDTVADALRALAEEIEWFGWNFWPFGVSPGLVRGVGT